MVILLPEELVEHQLDTWQPQQLGMVKIIPMGIMQHHLVPEAIIAPVCMVRDKDIPVVRETKELLEPMVLREQPLQLDWQEQYLLP
jgi:hypothetical protein